jgi:hypothetical protein
LLSLVLIYARKVWGDRSHQNTAIGSIGFAQRVCADRSAAMRLKPSSYLILGLLARGIKTGYAVKRAVEAWWPRRSAWRPNLSSCAGGGCERCRARVQTRSWRAPRRCARRSARLT